MKRKINKKIGSLAFAVIAIFIIAIQCGFIERNTADATTSSADIEYIAAGAARRSKPVPIPVSTASVGQVTASKLNVRTKPSLEGTIIGTVARGEKLSYYESGTDGWVKITYQDEEHYLSSDWIKELPDEKPEKPLIPNIVPSYTSSATTTYTSSGIDPSWTYKGSYRCSAYQWTGNPCANGNYPTTGYTVASGSEFKFGTILYISGIGFRTVEDRGGAISNGTLDLYMGDVTTCNNFGIQYLDVYVVSTP